MKQYLLVSVFFLSALLLTSCSGPNPSTDLINEKWQDAVEIKPARWAKGADRWFLLGTPNLIERKLRQGNPADISTVRVPAPFFKNIKANGEFQVQIFGASEGNTVFIFGPKDAVKAMKVTVRNKSLFISQKKNAPETIKQVIIRIGVRDLRVLEQRGCGTIETFKLCSSNLIVITTPSSKGNIYLSGKIRLRLINHGGKGMINVFNTHTPAMGIKTYGCGGVNISGKVGIQSIDHAGVGNINIVGANTNSLRIHASGAGKIGVQGIINLKKVEAQDDTRVYVYYVSSDQVYAIAHNNARIGLAGATRELYVDTFGTSSFEGRYLRTQNTFARARGASHMNVTANYEIFASAVGNSSIYYFGPAHLLTKFESGNGTVIPLGFDFVCRKCRGYERVGDFLPGAG